MMKQWLVSKPFKLSTILIITFLVVISVLLISFARSYFSESIFFLNNEKYKKVSEQPSHITYQSSNGPALEVIPRDDKQVVRINDEDYVITESNDTTGIIFHVSYPNGNEYTVQGQSDLMLSYDKNGEFVPHVSVYAGNERILSDGEELYYPGSFVAAAYREYQEKQGTPPLYWLAVFLLVLGWCEFRYEAFQNFLFIITPRYSWQDDEPNDFHYFLCKLCGVLTMVAALPVFFKSL